ncbi:MAG TPA: ABC transporter permease subunit [Clostridia bacterium]|nr:ABC transporter permease subunit [Clostridia bacterium]
MKASILLASLRKLLIRAASVLFWLAFWQLGSMALSQTLLLASPVAVLKRLAVLTFEPAFWRAVAFSFGRITVGFFTALFCGTLLAAAAARFALIRLLLSPLMALIKASPVASFIILLLIWVPSHSLSAVIAFMMALPIIYVSLCEGLAATDPAMLELAEVFGVSAARRVRYLYLSQLLPYLRSACAVSIGLCWKSGIAAEIIGIPKGSIGERLYEAKIYLDTPDLFAWTVVIVLLSMLFDRLFLSTLDTLVRRVERM